MTSDRLKPGSEFAGYRIRSQAGRGGMGVVYRAEDARLGRAVAVKLLAPELAADPSFRERFERESRLAAMIDHPSILPVYEAGESAGLLYIAMRWVEGSDLATLIAREGPLQPERTVLLLAQIGSALDAAHERGLVHRDLKPANILVTSSGGGGRAEHAYLTDFGIAKERAGAGLTRTAAFIGSPHYAPPEQFEGKELDGRADQYALAGVLVECLTGEPPFVRNLDVAVMYAHLHDPPPRLAERRPELPPQLDAVVARAMAKRRHDRYESCSAFIDAVRDAFRLHVPPPRWRARGTPAAAATVVDVVAPELPRSQRATRIEAAPGAPSPGISRPGRRRWLLIAVIALVLAGAGAAAAVLVSGGSTDPGVPRLAGDWDATATIEQAENVQSEPGKAEQPGDTFYDAWTFAPTCASGLCDVTLHRDNTGTTFTLTPSDDGLTYTGDEGFRAPFYCQGQTYPEGSTFHGAWTVRVSEVDDTSDPPRATKLEGRARIEGFSDEKPDCPVVRSVETFTFTAVPAAG